MAQEKAFENRVKDFLYDNGCWFVKYWGGGEFTRSGIPDILVCCKGHFVGVEIKAPKGRPSALQIRNLRKIHSAGGYSILLYPKDFSRFQRLIWFFKVDAPDEANTEYAFFINEWIKWENHFERKGVFM